MPGRTRRILLALWVCLVLGLPGSGWAQNIVDLILGKVAEPPGGVSHLDFNSDGLLDAADVVLQLAQEGEPVIAFARSTSRALEGNERYEVEVVFDRPFTGTVNWEVAGTAVSGSDYVLPGTSTPASGFRVFLPIDLVDNNVLESEVKTIELFLLDSTSYRTGSPRTHTVYLEDNDRVWDGTVSSGFFDYDVTLEIVEFGNSLTGKIVSDGAGAFPEGEFNLASISMTENAFLAESMSIAVDASSLVVRRPMVRRLRFVAGSSVAGSQVSGDLIQGELLEVIAAANAADAFLDSTVIGRFALLRRPQKVPQIRPTLVQAGSRSEGGSR